jgi:hypothetical protein
VVVRLVSGSRYRLCVQAPVPKKKS